MSTIPTPENCSLRGFHGATKTSVVCLILAGVLAVYFGAEAVLNSALVRGQGVGQTVPRLVAVAPTMSIKQYFRWGMWRADVRTLFAEARFLLDWSGSGLEERPTRLTGAVEVPNMAMPTNAAAVGPTA